MYCVVGIMSCFRSFHSWIETCTANGVTVDAEFLAGVQLGVGCFNLV